MGKTWKDTPENKDSRGSKFGRDKRKAEKRLIKAQRKVQREQERSETSCED